MRQRMSIDSKHELLLALRQHYLQASRKDKKQLLNGFVAATGYNRKHAIVLLRATVQEIERRRQKRQRKKIYDDTVWQALVELWRTANRICSKRLVSFLPDLLEAMERFGHLSLETDTRTKLLSLSASTIDRLLAVERKKYGGRSKSTTKPGYLLKKHIAVRTFADWNDAKPGFLEGDLVAHCGHNASGQFLNTFTLTDIATGWTELGALIRKSEADVMKFLYELVELLPFPLLGIDTDNGSEFINHTMLDWCRENKITFTRSREHKKNDQAHVEEKNGSIVRRLIGYDRYEGIESWQALSTLYRVARLYINFFQPSVKLVSKSRDGGHVSKRYTEAKTPYRRVLESAAISEEKKAELSKLFITLDPVLLLSEIERLQSEFWSTAVKYYEQQPVDTRSANPAEGTNLNITIMPVELRPQRTRKKLQPVQFYRPGNKAGRKTNVDEVWGEILQELQQFPALTPREIMQILFIRYPGKFTPGQENTIRDRLTKWRQDNSVNVGKTSSGKKTNLDEVWDEVLQELKRNASLSSRAIMRMLEQRYPGKFRKTQLSTVKNRLKKLRHSHLQQTLS